MYEFRTLLDRFWVTRREDKALYFSLKRALPDYRRLVNELLGWNLVVNESVVKLEKVPTRAMPWMGIQSFQEPMDYCLLCTLLLFLADLDDGAPFLLSSLTQAVETFLSEVQPVDWTRFPHRKSLVRVLQYAQEVGLVLVYDGNKNLDQFLTGELQLYRNGAFFLLSEGERCGALYPGTRALSDAALLLCAQIREQVIQGVYSRRTDDTVLLTRREFRYEIQRCRDRYGNGWGSQLRACSLEQISQELTAYMAGWMLLEELDMDILLYPAVGKLVGRYPAAYQNESGEWEYNEPLEDE